MKIQAQKCPSLSIQHMARFFDQQAITNYLKIPNTNLLLFNTIQKDIFGNALSSVVYYDDISKEIDNIINVIKPDYIILQMEFIPQTNQIMIASPFQLIFANIYTLSITNHLIFRNLSGMSLIQGTNLVIVTIQVCKFFIVDFIQIKQIFSQDTCYFNYDLDNPLQFPKTFLLQNGLVLISIKDNYGFQSWSFNITSNQLDYHQYLPEPCILLFYYLLLLKFNQQQNTILSEKNQSKTGYVDIDIDLDWNILFIVGKSYQINFLQIVDLSKGQFKMIQNLNLMNATDDFLNVKFIRNTSSSQNNQSLYLTDSKNILKLDFQIQGNISSQQIDSLTYQMAQNPFPITIEGSQYAFWYHLQENQQLILPLHNNLIWQSYTFVYSYADNTIKKRSLYISSGWSKIILVRMKETNYYVTAQLNTVLVAQDAPYGNIVWTLYQYQNQYAKENSLTQIQNYPDGFVIMFDGSRLMQIQIFNYYEQNYLDLSFLNLSFSRISAIVTSYLDQGQYLWVVFGLPFKDNKEKFLFWAIDFWNWNFQNLVSDNDYDNENQSCYALYSDYNKLIVGLDVLGNVYAWNSQNFTDFKFKKTITKYNCHNSLMGQLYNNNKTIYLIAVCDDYSVISFNLDTANTQYLVQMSSSSNHINSFEEINIIGIGERDTGNVFLFKFIQANQQFEFFLQIQTIKYKDESINLTYLPESQMLYIQYYYSNNYFPIGQCLKDRQSCLNCQMDFYFNSTESQLSNNFYGNGTYESPFLSSKSLINSFLLLQQYNDLINGVQMINTTIYVNPNNSLQVYQELINISFGNVINLEIKSIDSSVQAKLNVEGILQFQQFNILRLKNIIIEYLLTPKLNYQCGLLINDIVDSVLIDNINYKKQASNFTYSCYSMQINNSSVTVQNINISSVDFSHFQDLIQVSNSKQLILQNFTLQDSTLNSQFSIVRQISDTNVTINQMIISNNKCDQQQNQYSNNTGQLFQAGQFNVIDMKIIGNTFCNQKIFSTITNINQQNYFMLLQNISIVSNQFYIMASYLLFNAIYTFNPLPCHSLVVNNIYASDNQYLPYLQNQTTNNLMTTSLILVDKIYTIQIQNITSKNQNNLNFLTASQSQSSELYNITCKNDYFYFQSTSNKLYASCLQFNEVSELNLNMFNSSFIQAIDQSIISVQNQKYNNNKISMVNVEIYSCLFYQTQTNTYSNPILISSDQYSYVEIKDSYFHDNTLFGFTNSQTQSTTGIQIINSLGDNLIQSTKFNKCKSNALYNFMFVQSKSLIVNNSSFQYSSFDLQDTNTLFAQQGGSIRVKTVVFQVINTNLSYSTSNLASFIYIESQTNQINITFFNSSFSYGYASQDGGALYIDAQNSNISFEVNLCNFTDIYTLNSNSKAISIQNQDSLKGKSYNFIFKDIFLKNILGNIDSMFFSVRQSQINMQNLSKNYQNNYYLPAQFNEIVDIQNIQTSTLIYAENSNITINNTSFKNLFSSSKSALPLLFRTINSKITILKMKVSSSLFMPSLIDITTSELIINQTGFENLTLVANHRSLQLQNTNQQTNSNSLIKLENSSLTINDNSYFNQIICQYNCFGSCLYMIYSTFNLQNSSFTSSLAYNGGAIAILGINQINNTISNSKFTNNTAVNNGGAIYFEANQNDVFYQFLKHKSYSIFILFKSFQISLEDSQIDGNAAKKGYGGALFIQTADTNPIYQKFQINKTKIQNNIAYIGGGIYNQGINPQIYDSQIQFNYGQHYGNNQFSYPTELYLVNYQYFSSIGKNINIKSFKSGDRFPKFIFQLRDDSQKPIILTDGQQLTAQIQISQKNINSAQYYFRGNTLLNIDPIQNVFIFDQLDLIGIPGSEAIIEFVSDSIKVFNNNTQKYENSYTFDVLVNFRNCVYGEIFNSYNNYKECQTCEEGKYSLDFQGCYSCPYGGDCKNGIVQLQSGFWRKQEYSIDIIQCNNRLQNCVGNLYGNKVCITGNIGPLCEECDVIKKILFQIKIFLTKQKIYGDFWGKSYTRTLKYQCGLCQDQANNLWKLALTYFWILGSIYLAIKSELRIFLSGTLFKNISHKYKSAKKEISTSLDQSYILRNSIKNERQKTTARSSKNYIKVFTNYVQIISSSVSFNLGIDSRLIDTSSYLGAPIKTSTDFLEFNILLNNSSNNIDHIHDSLKNKQTTQQHEQNQQVQDNYKLQSQFQNTSQFLLVTQSNKINEKISQNLTVSQEKKDSITEIDFKQYDFQNKLDLKKSYFNFRKNSQNPFHKSSKILKVDYEKEDSVEMMEQSKQSYLMQSTYSLNQQNQLQEQK
ncbi:hypothetical protein ABPG73_022323 [Tetrahymena malaccensis]